jgi:hypothetical protein
MRLKKALSNTEINDETKKKLSNLQNPWTDEELQKLKDAVQTHGRNWVLISQCTGKSTKACLRKA